ncbi:MAG TPA: TonB-dependent receptor [Paludibacter sp.]|nr:TonB-dependent receptor [Paludibacter sp.]HPM10693.1 TonB-dependent receptor [Paludibacter sp.]
MENTQITIKKRSAYFFMLIFFIPHFLFSQNTQISGHVTDENNEPVIGAQIIEKGTKNGTISRMDGSFSLQVQSLRAKLEVISLGYESTEISLDGKNFVNIVLKETSLDLEEVVVIGYGTAKKSDLTGSITSIKSDELMKTNPVSINQALQGKISGVQVNQSDGAPGAGISIQIRGANSFTTSTEPLYVIDGIPYGSAPGFNYEHASKQSNNPLNLINPKDISSIEVLKDASATAIYGSRGANGVILITTKKGALGKAKIDLTTNFGVSNIINSIEVLDAATYAEYRNEQVINGYTYDGLPFTRDDQLPYPAIGYWQYTRLPDPLSGDTVVVDSVYVPSAQDFRNGYLDGGTNWLDQIFRTAFSQDYNISVSGADNRGQYLFSGGYLDQQGIIFNSFYKRYNVRSNITRKITDWLEIGNNLSFTKSKNRMARTNVEAYGVIPSAIGFNPTRPVFDPEKDSGFSEDLASGLSNPYLYTRAAKNIVSSMNILSSAFAEISFTKQLKFRQNIGYGYNSNAKNEYYNRWVDVGLAPKNGYAVQADNYYESFTSESMLMYYATLAEIHQIGAVAAWTYEDAGWGEKIMRASNFPNDLTEEHDMSAGLIQEKNNTQKGKSSLMSYLGRINYTLKSKYLFTVSYRRDGSSRLGKGNRWADFFSGAFAWHLGEEPWIKSLNTFDTFKLRISAGQTGNQGVAAYATRSKMLTQNKGYTYDNSYVTGFAEDYWNGPSNPNLKWETTTQYNLGIDVGFLKNRINFVIDLYKKDTKDLLQYMIIPNSTGFKGVYTNYGNVENRGLEITGSFHPISQRDFSWKIDINTSMNRNKIGGLRGDQFADVAWGLESMFLRRNGQPIGLLYGYKEDGFFDNEAEVRAYQVYADESDAKIKSMIGQVKYKDLNNDGMLDDRDKTIIGNTNPDFIYGITNTLTYKDFTLNLFIQGSQGNDILNANVKKYDLSGIDNLPKYIWDERWTEKNKLNARSPRPDATYSRAMRASDRYVEDGSYIRLKNVSLSYLLKTPFDFIETLRISVGATNLFTITKYRWYDPDVNSFGSDPSRRGVDMSSYPNARVFNIGFQLVF